MKRVVNHPKEPATGKTYWRSVDEYTGSPEFAGWLEREFPQGAAEFWGDDLSRRSFMRLAGASMALAGLGLAGCRRPEAYIVPFTKSVEWMLPGKPMHYATAMPTRAGAEPLLVTSFNGRPIKIEGNPLHPYSLGKSGTHAQASVLGLYDPDRATQFTHQGVPQSAEAFEKDLASLREASLPGGGAGLAILADAVPSPTRERLRAELAKQFPNMTWAAYDPLASAAAKEFGTAYLGANRRLRVNYAKADIILSLECDFLGCDNASGGGLEASREFAKRRRVKGPDAKMNRLYVAESCYTLTGGQADHRLRVSPGGIPSVLAAVARELGVAAPDVPLPEGVNPEWIAECAKDLKAHAGAALVQVGAQYPAAVQALAADINNALGAFSGVLEVVEFPEAPAATLADLAAKIGAGTVQHLIILGGNPVYNAPADLKWAELQAKVPAVYRLGLHHDETSELATWHIPATHYLEEWGDALCADGSYLCLQPLILPLYAGWSQIRLLARLAGLPAGEGPELVQDTFRQRVGGLLPTDFETRWNLFVRDGFLAASKVNVTALGSRSSGFIAASGDAFTPAPLGEHEVEVVFRASPAVDDGSFANNGWLQETPDPISKLTWDNAAYLSQKTANDLGLKTVIKNGVTTGDVVILEIGGVLIEAPTMIIPGHADGCITLPLGYGRTKAGRVGSNVGFNAYPARTSQAPFLARAKASPAGRSFEFAVTQEHWSMEGRAIVREAPLHYYQQDHGFTRKLGLESHTPENVSFYKRTPAYDYENNHQWGMVIDLSACTGCNACLVACLSENNIPIVGKDQVKKGREMHWIRIDRYWAGRDIELDRNATKIPDNPEMVTQAILCMQCENAPCETVCPVNATVHNPEGLNVMAYNRCIGTRYCANNCPYKVRRFNFFDYNQRQLDKLYNAPFWPDSPKGVEESLKLQKNPNVTVRMRGVMEKCTFCVQRLESAKISWKVQNKGTAIKRLPTDSVQVACQQACPSDSIVFGDLADPNSRVAAMKKEELNYNVLDYLNTQPRVSYLARIRNPNLHMPEGDLVGMGLVNSLLRHGSHEEHHEAAEHEAGEQPSTHGENTPAKPEEAGHAH
jgi:molybdopterin-containing oxidoreductase family iron-sulfur binding subunit